MNESNLISITTSDNADNVTVDENNIDFLRCQQQESSSTETRSNSLLTHSSLSSTLLSQLPRKETPDNKTTKDESSKTLKKNN